MRHSSVIDTDIDRCLRRSLLGDRCVQLFPDHFERRRITGQVRQRGLPFVADRFSLLAWESVVQIDGESIIYLHFASKAGSTSAKLIATELVSSS
jgi:hypothetical protein